jgi:hypothetical protein
LDSGALQDHCLDQPPQRGTFFYKDKQLKLWDNREKEIHKKLKDQEFVLAPAFNPALLQAIGMDSKFGLVFKT